MFKRILLAIATIGALSTPALAQTSAESITGFRLAQGSTYNGFTCPTSNLTPCFVQYGSAIPVTGTFSASLAGFNATAGATANLTDLVNTSQDVALPAGADVSITNKGSVPINFRMQAGAGVAVATDQTLIPGATAGIHITTQTHISAIAPTGTATGATAGQLNIQGGTGLVTGYGGGSSSGSGGNVTIVGPLGSKVSASSVSVVIASDQAAIPASQSGTWNVTNISGTVSLPTGASTSALQTTGNTSLSTIAGAVTASVMQDNLKQVNGVTVLTGTGATGTGAQRVTVATDTATIAGSAPGTAGTPSANVVSIQGVASGTVVPVSSGVAQGSTTSGQTVSPIGCRTLSATPTDTTAQTNMPVCTLQGALLSSLYALPDDMVSGTTASMTGTTQTQLLAAPAGSLHNYVTELSCVNSSATVGTDVTIEDGSGGTALKTVAAASLFGGQEVSFPTPLRQPTAATALFVVNVTTGAAVICSATGYKAL